MSAGEEGGEAALTHWRGTKGSMVWSQEPLPSIQQAFEVHEYTVVGELLREKDTMTQKEGRHSESPTIEATGQLSG